ncbi:MAG: alpha/beta fold hydrolase [Syntrophales bacterium]|nr:alpha/beta fold hydrolase [Syntrophales bacterium]
MSNSNYTNYGAFDRPEILRFLFYPRPEWNLSFTGNTPDSITIPVDDNINVGGYFHLASRQSANILFFHGNGEIAADYHDVAPFFTTMGINFIPVDYRGYGRSSGHPTVASMMKDCHVIFEYIRDWLKGNSCTGPLIVMGRSLGSAPALELVKHHGDMIGGLIIESGFAYIEPLLLLLGVNMAALGISEDRSFRNIEKIKTFEKPTLVIHSQYDHIIAISEGKALFEASPAKEKRFLTVPGANHNNIFVAGMNDYMKAIGWLVDLVKTGMNRG